MSVSLTPAVPPTVWTASSYQTTTNVSVSLASQVEGARADTVCVSLNPVRTEEPVLYPAPLHWDTFARVSLVLLGPTVKEACPVESSPVTMEAAVHLPQEERAAPVCLVSAGPSVSIALMKAAPPSLAIMEGYVQKRPASRSSTASVPVVGQVNGVSRAVDPPSSPLPCALLLTAIAKQMMAFVTRSATYSLVAGMVVTALLLLTLGLVVLTLAAGESSTTASVTNPVTTPTVSTTTLTAKAKKKSAIQYMKPTVLITMLMDDVTRAVTPRSVAGTAWIVQRMFQKTLQMDRWFW